MRPIVEGMGLNWAGQQQKLSAAPRRFGCMGIHTTAADGKTYEMGCIPLRRYPMWLATINPAKIPRPEVRRSVSTRPDQAAGSSDGADRELEQAADRDDGDDGEEGSGGFQHGQIHGAAPAGSGVRSATDTAPETRRSYGPISASASSSPGRRRRRERA